MNDERHGQGHMKWVDGSSYDGEWAHGIQHGKGKMVFPSGKIKEGMFADNVYTGEQEMHPTRSG